ncbi:single-stranded DNA-binding protein [Bartonella sp. DGB1]|uniref:single-stranded DNA-binding protein n=1 Tax=Bartonella sp. DGB1 TaxID=3239807 RepID=UPI0035237475
MYALNRVTLIGNVATDIDCKILNSGDSIVRFRLVTSERWKDNNGEIQEKPEWHNIVIFNEKLVKLVEKSLTKGDRIMVEGQLHTRKWQDREEQIHFKTEVILHKSRGKLLLMRRNDSLEKKLENDIIGNDYLQSIA